MANNYQSPEIVTMARRLMEEEGLTPDQALAKAQMIMDLPAEGLQGTMVGPELEAYKRANPQDFVPDNVKRFVDPNDPLYPQGDFMKYMQNKDDEEERRRAAMRMMRGTPRLRNPVTNTNPGFMGMPSLMNMK